MNKYMIGFFIFIGFAPSLCASDNSKIFDYVASRDEVAVLSMIEKDFDVFDSLGLHIFNKNVFNWRGRECDVKVVRDNECTIGAIFYTSFFDFDYPCWEICFLVVDKSYRNQGYGSLMIKSVIAEMKEATGNGTCKFAPLANLFVYSGLEDQFDILRLLSDDANSDAVYKPQHIIYLDLDPDMIFSKACRNLDIEKIKKCLTQGIDVNQQFVFKDIPYHGFVKPWDLKYPLCFAIENNNCELAEIFINAGASIFGICNETTPLRIAMEQFHNVEMMILLIKAGCDVNELGRYDESLLSSAISNLEDIEIAKILIEAGANIDCRPCFGLSLLKHAMMKCNPEFVSLLLKFGYDLNQDFDITTPLHRAVYYICDLVIFDALLAAGVDIDSVDINGLTALDYVEEMLDDRCSKSFNGYRLKNEIDQLGNIKAYLLLHTY